MGLQAVPVWTNSSSKRPLFDNHLPTFYTNKGCMEMSFDSLAVLSPLSARPRGASTRFAASEFNLKY